MSNGLEINGSSFENLNQSQKLTILFNNTEYVKNSIRNWKTQMRIQWYWLSGLTILVLGLFGIKSAGII